tara:strand:+ start:134 stop:397 length:264 start_codon:yes stop_codon:yes gene_type:complete
MEQGTKDKIERLKDKADFFIDNNIKAFVKDNYNNFYFCQILLVGETHLLVKNFAGKRAGENDRLLWIDIDDIKEYKLEVEGDGTRKD